MKKVRLSAATAFQDLRGGARGTALWHAATEGFVVWRIVFNVGGRLAPFHAHRSFFAGVSHSAGHLPKARNTGPVSGKENRRAQNLRLISRAFMAVPFSSAFYVSVFTCRRPHT